MSEQSNFSKLENEIEELVRASYGDSARASLLMYSALWGKALAYLTEEQLATMVRFEKERQAENNK